MPTAWSQVWDVDGIELAELRGHVNYALDATFDPRGNVIHSAGDDGTVRSWVVAPDAAVHGPVTNVDLSPDGQRVVAGAADGRLRVWSADLRRTLLDQPAHAGRFWASFSPDGRRIVSHGEDGYVRVH